MRETREFQERIGQVERLVQKLESAADPALKATARQLVEALMDLHGAALERILEIISRAGEAGVAAMRSMARDELVSCLLVLYDLHPDDFQTRAQKGIDKAKRLVATRGGALEVVAIDESKVHLRIRADGRGCGSASTELEPAIRDALFEAAPDALEIVIDGLEEKRAASGFVPLAELQASNGSGSQLSRP